MRLAACCDLSMFLDICFHGFPGGIQFATAQLPLLQLIDCGMSICAINSQYESPEENGLIGNEGSGELGRCQKSPMPKPQAIYQKLIIKHGCLRKISLWGCSGLDVSHTKKAVLICSHYLSSFPFD